MNREDMSNGCLPAVVGMVACLVLLALSFCSCKPQQKIVEVEKVLHDTTTIVDTVHVRDSVTLHDSIYIKETVVEHVKDSTQTDVAWKHWTYDKEGNVTSLTDYSSTTQHGKSSHTSTESASTAVSNQASTHEEKGGHSESSGHSEASNEKVYVKVGLSKWQSFLQVMGYAFLAILTIGAVFGGWKIYAHKKSNKVFS